MQNMKQEIEATTIITNQPVMYAYKIKTFLKNNIDSGTSLCEDFEVLFGILQTNKALNLRLTTSKLFQLLNKSKMK